MDELRPGRAAERDAALHQAALELLAEVGYDRMSMDAVASRAHASKATIYRRWPSKRELVLDAIRHRASSPVCGAAGVDAGSLRADLLATLRAIAAHHGEEETALMAGVLRAMRSNPELADCTRASLLDGKGAVFEGIAARAVARGEVPPGTDPWLWHEVAPALLLFRVLVLGKPLDDAYLEHVIDDVLVPLLASGCQRARAGSAPPNLVPSTPSPSRHRPGTLETS